MSTSTHTAHTSQNRPLRLITCGSVDDGKSTLIGRLLFDSKALMIDQLDALGRARGAQSQSGKLDLSLVTDGLEAEREQGITIDVAYRYFNTPHRKFIIADAPGHEQYTRNMVTGASKSDVAIVLIDVTKLDFSAPNITLLPQTKRHSALAGLLGLQHLVVAVNKMDAIDFDEAKFNRVVAAFADMAKTLHLPPFIAIPISALEGDGVVTHSARTSWHKGLALLPLLESLEIRSTEHADSENSTAHIAVQWVTRDKNDDHQRWFTGDLAEAPLSVGDLIQAFPSGTEAIVAEITTARGSQTIAQPGEAVAVRLDRQVDIARGDWIIAKNTSSPATALQKTQAVIAWLDNAPLTLGRRYVVRHGARWLPARITAVHHKLDLHSAEWKNFTSESGSVEGKDLVKAEIEFAQALPLSSFKNSHALGAFVVVDPGTNATAAAGMVI